MKWVDFLISQPTPFDVGFIREVVKSLFLLECKTLFTVVVIGKEEEEATLC
jgi:hypothetical protein